MVILLEQQNDSPAESDSEDSDSESAPTYNPTPRRREHSWLSLSFDVQQVQQNSFPSWLKFQIRGKPAKTRYSEILTIR